jgi:predicted CXXCH cytochrome family protein
MNARNTLFAALALGLATAGASGQITGSAHDFTQYAWNPGEICKPCHIPHGGNWQAGKLWNHTLPADGQTYNLYQGTGTTAYTTDYTGFDATSRLCLSCHDGTVALDSFGGTTTGGTTFLTAADPEYIGTDLRNDHPIGSRAIYDTTGTSTSFHPQNASHSVVGSAGTLRLRSWTDPSDGTTKYVVGCKTCHNPHRTAGAEHLLNFSNVNSQLCLTCHIK